MPYIPYYCRLQYSIILQLPKIKGTKSRCFCNATHKDIAVLRNDTLRSPIKEVCIEHVGEKNVVLKLRIAAGSGKDKV